VAHDLARAAGGEFLVRIEDIDGTRSQDTWIWEAFADLTWLGLEWDDEPVYQSSRVESYADAGARLFEMGLIYPCNCTRREVAKAARHVGPGGHLYPGTCRDRIADIGADTAWRLDMAKAIAYTGPLDWHDSLAGQQRCIPEMFGDVVLLRKEAPASYHLAATLDDAADGITLVTRGRDLFQASHIHRLLQALLGLQVPSWHHHLLLVEPDGQKLAKRRGSASLGDLRRAGEDGRALADALRRHRFPAGISLG
jgi:glutamyl-Q tRNA(Asp) synthetase